LSFDTFAALGCSEPFLSAHARRGFTTPTQVQAETFGPGLEGRDLLVQSRTGSGKTLAFGLPLLHRLKEGRQAQAIILTPTRELAQQVAAELGSVTPGLATALLVGGLSYVPQLKALKGGARVVVGTPGRVQDHLDRGTLDLSGVAMVVLDECDEMLNMGFLEDVEKILADVPPGQQTYLFSATLPAPIAALAKRFLQDPVRISHAQAEGTSQHADITHTPCLVAESLHTKALVNFLLADQPSSALIFTKMKVTSEEVAQSLRNAGLPADCLHGDLSQQSRNRIMSLFKEGKLRYLVATDVAARGIDVEAMPLVVHLGIPTQMESYIHRSGRTGRAGAKGASLALVGFKESRILLAWARRGGLKLEWRSVPTQGEIRETRTRRLAEQVAAVDAPRHLEAARRLLEGRDPAALVASLLSLVDGEGGEGFDIPDLPKPEFRPSSRPFKPRPGEKPGWSPGSRPGPHQAARPGQAAGVRQPPAPAAEWTPRGGPDRGRKAFAPAPRKWSPGAGTATRKRKG
jgi:ATP-dependent RNA helicase DeaD